MRNKILIIFALLVLIVILVFVFISLDYHKESKEGLAKITFNITDDNSTNFICEIADSSEEREKGLMFRENLSEDKGMLFVFEEATNTCFWMKNTLIPLDIIFIDENNSVVNIEEAIVQLNISDIELIRYCSESASKYVVEINKGLSGEYGIKKGTTVKIEYI